MLSLTTWYLKGEADSLRGRRWVWRGGRLISGLVFANSLGPTTHRQLPFNFTHFFSLLKQTKKTLAWENDPYFPTTQQKQTRQFTKSLRSSERGKHLPWPSFPCWLQSTSLIRVCTTVRQPLIFTWMCLHAPHTKIMLSSKVLDLIHHHQDRTSPDIAPYNRIVRAYGSTSLPIT